LNTLWSLFPVYTAMGIPTAIFILTEFIRGLPGELYEAGYMDGANRLKIYWKIVLPLIRPALATVAIYNLVPIWNDLWFPLIFINLESQKTVLLAVTKLQGQYTTDWPKLLAILSLSALPVIILYLTMSKQFIKGLTAGAVKG
jgi:raffinose/stachyose/melibiose transport system permease protein